MAVNWKYVQMLDQRGWLRPGVRILDIGSSNLYSAEAEGLRAFLAKYNPAMPAADAAKTAERLAEGSFVHPVTGATNKAFVGELFEAAGMVYQAFDIANGYRTEILDFNRQDLPAKHRGAYDVILNFGTTEHIVHQFNSFKIIHEAAHVGTVTWHQLPAIGFVDHCYFAYRPRFFFEIAAFNGYDLVDFWYGGGGSSKLLDIVADYGAYFPILTEYARNPAGAPQPHENVTIPNYCANVMYRKLKDTPFMPSVECSTSVGEVPEEVKSAYRPGAEAKAEPIPHVVAAVVTPAPSGGALRALKNVLRPVVKALRGAPR